MVVFALESVESRNGDRRMHGDDLRHWDVRSRYHRDRRRAATGAGAEAGMALSLISRPGMRATVVMRRRRAGAALCTGYRCSVMRRTPHNRLGAAHEERHPER